LNMALALDVVGSLDCTSVCRWWMLSFGMCL